MPSISFQYETDDGEEVEVELPAIYEICHRCEGHGTHLNPSIGEHAYTREEFEEAFSDEESREQYFKRGGIYDVTCEHCKGLRVVAEVDAACCDKELLKKYYEHQESLAQMRAEERYWARLEGGG